MKTRSKSKKKEKEGRNQPVQESESSVGKNEIIENQTTCFKNLDDDVVVDRLSNYIEDRGCNEFIDVCGFSIEYAHSLFISQKTSHIWKSLLQQFCFSEEESTRSHNMFILELLSISNGDENASSAVEQHYAINLSFNIRTTELDKVVCIIIFHCDKNQIFSLATNFSIAIRRTIVPFDLSVSLDKRIQLYTNSFNVVASYLGMNNEVNSSSTVSATISDLLTFAINYPTLSLDDLLLRIDLFSLTECTLTEIQYRSSKISRSSIFYPEPQTKSKISLTINKEHKSMKLSNFRKSSCDNTSSKFLIRQYQPNFEKIKSVIIRSLFNGLESTFDEIYQNHLLILKKLRNLLCWRRNLQKSDYELNELREIQPIFQLLLEKIIQDIHANPDQIDVRPAQQQILQAYLEIENNDNEVEMVEMKGFTDVFVYDQSSYHDSTVTELDSTLFCCEIKKFNGGLSKSDGYSPKDQFLCQLKLLSSMLPDSEQHCLGGITDVFVICLGVREFSTESNKFLLTKRIFDLQHYILIIYLLVYLSTIRKNMEMFREILEECGNTLTKSASDTNQKREKKYPSSSEDHADDEQKDSDNDGVSRKLNQERIKTKTSKKQQAYSGSKKNVGKSIHHSKPKEENIFLEQQLEEDIDFLYSLTAKRKKTIHSQLLLEQNRENIDLSNASIHKPFHSNSLGEQLFFFKRSLNN